MEVYWVSAVRQIWNLANDCWEWQSHCCGGRPFDLTLREDGPRRCAGPALVTDVEGVRCASARGDGGVPEAR
jgi:hypothetical protein